MRSAYSQVRAISKAIPVALSNGLDERSQLKLPSRLSRASLLACWVLILIFACDLASSPFHRHSHDSGNTISAIHDDHAGTSFDIEGAAHVEDEAGHAFSHSLSMLLFRPSQPDPVRIMTVILAPFCTMLWYEFLLASRETANDGPQHIPILSDWHLRPDNRAPPFHHG